MDMSNDVLIKILIRLPPKCVFKFMCVSKRWNQMINNPLFLRCCAKGRAGRLMGFMQTENFPRNHLPFRGPETKILSLSSKERYSIPRELGHFVCSSNGLILCGHDSTSYNVMNPLTKKWVSIPSPHKDFLEISSGLVCEESTTQLVATYKVVRFGVASMNVLDDKLMSDTYSSKTGIWVISTLVATDKFHLLPFNVLHVLHGVFHWVVSPSYVAVYDPNHDIGGENHLQLIEEPSAEIIFSGHVLSRSIDDILWYGNITHHGMQIWVLPKSRKEWRLVHNFNIHCFMSMIALSPENPLIVYFKIGKKIFIYNTKAKLMKLVQQLYHGQPIDDHFNNCTLAPILRITSFVFVCSSIECIKENYMVIVVKVLIASKKEPLKGSNSCQSYIAKLVDSN